MAFDQSTRNFLQRTVTKCREILAGRWQAPTEGEFFRQLQEIYGISPDGLAAPMEVLAHLGDEDRETACVLRDTIDHYTAGLKASGKSEKEARREAVMRVAREQAFTVLNRLAALRMAEERGIVLECVRKGTQSEGFQLFLQSAGSAFGSTSSAYRAYLHLLFDELARDLGVLFNRFDKGSLIFPRHEALESLLKELNGTGEANRDASFSPEQVASLWGEDETVGWIYQYYNDPSERKKMREESAAPRNSRELAVRNQFFTPRYVVEFLTDNTLGRIWYEMTQGDTTLKEQCRYLARRHTEIFLQPNETAPEQLKQDNLSQEDLLKQPVHIPHRPLKDPRIILMLDPACGSMHFGLYAFDLFEVIYNEAWTLEEKLGAAILSRPSGMKSLHDTYAGKDAFLKDVPRLIIENNIHGIDIDPRAAQIAGLSLWLRAQKAWQRLGLAPAQRPAIKRSNIVCAEPMPGEKELLSEFVEREFPAAERAVCLRLLEAIFDKMQLAGEAGSLLKIEEEIRSAIDEAKKQWKAGPRMEQSQLFGGEKFKQQDIPIDYSGLTEGEFWDQLEEKVYTALRDYAEQAEHGGGFQRRLFAEDAARGFAFIDVCRKRYDVALMNPPFGEPTGSIEQHLAKQYPRTKNNLYGAFVERQFDLCPAGFVGLISARTFVMYRDFEKFRRELLLGSASIVSFADLGWEVLDGAQVETAAFVLARERQRTAASGSKLLGPFIRLLTVPVDAKGDSLLRACGESKGKDVYFAEREQFFALPGAPLAYWASRRLVEVFSKSATFEPSLAYCGRGAAAHAFFFRLAWEIPAVASTADNWRRLAHGGEYSPFFRENSVFIDWENDGQKVKEYILKQYPYLNGNFGWAIQDEDKYGRVGLTSGKRNERFNVQLMPAGHIFTNEGQGFIPHETKDVWFSLGYLNSSLVSYFLALTSGLQKTWIYIRPVPVVAMDVATRSIVEMVAEESYRIKHRWSAGAEEASLFATLWLFSLGSRDSLRRSVERLAENHGVDSSALDSKRAELSGSILAAINLDADDEAEIIEDFKRHPKDFAFPAWRDASASEIEQEIALRLSSYLVGVAFGRWDIRYATGEQAAPELPDPFAPLPVCPPGQLQNAQGLPARPEDVPAAYPVRIPWDGILADDPNHPLDIERRVREVIEIIWSGQEGGPTAEAIEHEACEILGVKSLRDYFRKPAGFFADHLKRYSKSRRQAPIYWPLSTASGGYTVWIYYHRLTPDTLYKCLQQFVEPKIKDVEQEIHRLRTMLTADEAGSKERKQLADAETLLHELKELHAELSLWAPKWKPNLNDGVLITSCPLWKLFRLPKWRKDLEACWKELETGDYDWAHLAYTLFPARVREKCKTDRSLAIAHGLEDVCQVQAPTPKKTRSKKASA